MKRWNPSQHSIVGSKPDKAFFGNYPTLSQLRREFGTKAATSWLLPQLYDLSEFCGVREKLQGRPLEECAQIIETQYHWLKVTEIMLFLYRFKGGHYGHFYGTVDPLVIMTALRTFISERGEAYARREQEERERREASQPKPITWEDHCRLHGITNKPRGF